MKSFVAAMILFSLLIVLIIGNACYVRHVSETLLHSLDTLSLSDEPSALDALEEYWHRHRALTGLSVGTRELDRLNESLLLLRAAYDTQDASEFIRYQQTARQAAEDLSRLERFSPENLF